jgi:hypothetical protein
MVAVRKDGSTVAERTMYGERHANGQPLHPARKGLRVRSFDDQVQVLGLDREVNDPKAVLFARCDRIPHRLEEQPIAAETWKPLASSQRYVDRISSEMALPSAMGHANLAHRSLAASARSSTAMSRRLSKRKSKLGRAIAHLELGRSLPKASDIEQRGTTCANE